jgi:beta-glucosidase
MNESRRISLLILSILFLASGYVSASVSQQKSVKEIVKSMTLEQKAQLVIGT